LVPGCHGIQDRTKLEHQLTPNKNTVLHIAAMFGNTECANEVLRYSPSLSCRVNIQGDTPLHIAARKGCSDIVQALVKYTTRLDKKRVGARKEMLRMLNKESDTPLHEAVRNCHFDVVKLLVEEDPDFLCPANNAEETPLYLASEKNLHSTSLQWSIWKNCFTWGINIQQQSICLSGSMASLLGWKPSLVKETDLHGWTPLHFAARIGYASIVSQLLEADKSLGYIADNDDKNTALHIAAGHGHIDVMREFFEHCPDCCEMRPQFSSQCSRARAKEGRYIHPRTVAIAISLTNQKDIDGNTPLHLLVTSDCNAQGLIWHSGADRNAFNKKNLTPMDVIEDSEIYMHYASDMERQLKRANGMRGWRNVIHRDKEMITSKKKKCADRKKTVPYDLKKEADTHFLVAALIATVAFTAGFTIPGGFYGGNDGPNQAGKAVLIKEVAFKAFIISDAIALLFSTMAIVIYFVAADYDDRPKLNKFYGIAGVLIVLAIGAMMVAFITGCSLLAPNKIFLSKNQMDLSLYRAAMEGKVDITRQDRTKLEHQLTPNKNTVLHIAAMFGNTECANEVLRYSPSLSCRVNIQGDTALHISARNGCSGIVEALVKCTRLDKERVGAGKEMLRMLNKENDTPLHEAVRNCHFDVVKLLVEEDRDFSCPANNAEETPLYLASEKGYDELVSLISKTCTEPAYSGPDGRTALHGAAISNSKGSMASLLVWKPSLVKETDVHGWTPLHFAARFGYASVVSQLLEADKSLGYIADNDDKNTALHIAAGHGHIAVMREFFEHCPDCCEMVNARGRNFLHNAVEHVQRKAVTYILEQCAIAISLINQKDIDGNTPLHLLATSDCPALGLISHSIADTNAFNKDNLTPVDVMEDSDIYMFYGDDIERIAKRPRAMRGRRNVFHKDKEIFTSKKKSRAEIKKIVPHDIKKVADTHLLVAALIATVAFTAGFTIPGGFYGGNDGPNQAGKAILMKEVAFKTFIISDTIALLFSTLAIVIYFVAAECGDRAKLKRFYGIASLLIGLAIGAMMVTFIAGVYATLTNSSALAIAACVVGCSAFPIYYVIFKTCVSDGLEPCLPIFYVTA
ncbi:hypothetical protein RJ639_013518, partial [Escallonia herrerae]